MFDFDVEKGVIRSYGEIGGLDEISADGYRQAFDAMDGRDIIIELDSEGGNVRDGTIIYNMIDQYPGQVTVRIDAWAASIASYFPMSADRVIAFDNSNLMIHRAWTLAMGDAAEMRATADVLEKLDGDIAAGYARRTGKASEYFLELMAKTTYFSAQEAAAEGLVDEVIERGPAQPQNRVHGKGPIGRAWLNDAGRRYVQRLQPTPSRDQAFRTVAAVRACLTKVDERLKT